jgi:tetratricopeptide (TPR) repeat protein
VYDLQKIAHFIAHPEQMTAADMPVFKQLAEEHAYTPVFSILYLKALSRFNPLVFEKELKHYAYMIPSREVLYELVHATITEAVKEDLETNQIVTPAKTDVVIDSDSIAVTEVQPIESEQPTIIELQDDLDGSLNTSTPPIEIDSTGHTVQSDQRLSTEDVPSIAAEEEEVSDALSTSKDTAKEETKVPFRKEEYDSLEKEILAHAVGASISLEIDKYIEEEELETQSLHEIEKAEKALVEPVDFDELDASPSETCTTDFSQRRSFTEWLAAGNNEKEVVKTPSLTPIVEESRKTQKKNHLDIAPKKEPSTFFSAAAQAKQSLDYTGIPVTETLAKIYDAQGNLPRALEAYEQLILKIPEKKVFFALQIEKLKKKLNK